MTLTDGNLISGYIATPHSPFEESENGATFLSEASHSERFVQAFVHRLA